MLAAMIPVLMIFSILFSSFVHDVFVLNVLGVFVLNAPVLGVFVINVLVLDVFVLVSVS